jgi:hypothetical protein
MKKRIYLIVFVLMSLFGFSQSSAIGLEKNNSIVSNFSEASIVVYQEVAIDKINDFYSYLNLYKEVKSVALQQEIDINVRTIFFNENVEVFDFIQDNNNVHLDVLLKQCKKEKFTYTVSNFKKETPSKTNFFLITYDLEIINEAIKKYKMIQKVYFFPSVKSFGSEKKNVWQLKLGEFNAVQ